MHVRLRPTNGEAAWWKWLVDKYFWGKVMCIGRFVYMYWPNVFSMSSIRIDAKSLHSRFNLYKHGTLRPTLTKILQESSMLTKFYVFPCVAWLQNLWTTHSRLAVRRQRWLHPLPPQTLMPLTTPSAPLIYRRRRSPSMTSCPGSGIMCSSTAEGSVVIKCPHVHWL